MNVLWDHILKAKTLVKVAGLNAERMISPAVKYGLLTSFLLITGFFCANSLGVKSIFVFPLLYFLFLTPGIYYALWKLSDTGKENSINYFEGLKEGITTSLVAVLVYAAVISFYIASEKGVLDLSDGNKAFDLILNPFTAGLSFIFEGLAFGVVITFSFMQYFKKEV
jgi:hypothetical protein